MQPSPVAGELRSVVAAALQLVRKQTQGTYVT